MTRLISEACIGESNTALVRQKAARSFTAVLCERLRVELVILHLPFADVLFREIVLVSSAGTSDAGSPSRAKGRRAFNLL
jgi:hypothetical protein